MDMTGVVDAPINSGEATAKETPDSSAGTESVASEVSHETPNSAGEGQPSTQDGSGTNPDTRGRGKSPFAENRRLQAKMRDMENAYNTRLQELSAQMDEMRGLLRNGGQEEDPSGAFWKDPSKYLDDRFGSFEKRLMESLSKVQSDREQATQRSQEMSEAVKFIRSQKGMTDESVEEIRDLLRDIPGIESLSPLAQAKVALGLWLQEKGVGDKSAIKAKAGIPSGAPPSNGKRIWTTADIESEIAKFGRDYANWTPEKRAQFETFEREVKQAQLDGRVK